MIQTAIIVLGLIVLVLFLAAIMKMHHAMARDLWEDIIRDEFEERYNDELEFRWKNQDVKIHAQLIITDEMRKAV